MNSVGETSSQPLNVRTQRRGESVVWGHWASLLRTIGRGAAAAEPGQGQQRNECQAVGPKHGLEPKLSSTHVSKMEMKC